MSRKRPPCCPKASAEPVQCIFNSNTVERNPSLQVFGIGIPLLCLIVFCFFIFYSSFVLMVWAVTRLLKQGCSYSYTNITPVLRYLRPGLPRCYLVMSDVGVLLSKQLLFSDRMVHLWIFPHSRPPTKTSNTLSITCSIVACDLF